MGNFLLGRGHFLVQTTQNSILRRTPSIPGPPDAQGRARLIGEQKVGHIINWRAQKVSHQILNYDTNIEAVKSVCRQH